MKQFGMVSFTGRTRVGPFYMLIWEGVKRQTIREPRKDGQDHVKIGRPFSLYWKVRRTEKEGEPHRLGLAMCTAYEAVKLIDMWDDEANALADGFIDLNEFRDWFFGGWREAHWLDDLIEAYRSIDRSVYESVAKAFPGAALSEFLTSEYRRIKWKYPLIETTCTDFVNCPRCGRQNDAVLFSHWGCCYCGWKG